MDSAEIKSIIDSQIISNLDCAIEQQCKKWDCEKYYFDKEEALRFYKFTQKLKLDKGKKGAKIQLLKFQFNICTDILCVKRKSDNLRKVREAHINIPRKNGKSFIIGLIIAYMYFFRTEYGAEYIITANTTKQAALLFNTIKHFITNSPLKKRCKITDSQKIIYRKDENSYLRVLSCDGSNADSFADLVFCQDEIHELKNTLIYDKLKTGQGIFDEPLGITITTASSGTDPLNLEMELYKYSKSLQKGEFEDDSFYSAIFEADEGCDIMDISQWFKSNPALGHFRKLEDLENLAKRATQLKTREASFRRFFLNQHVSMIQENAINMILWNKCLKKINIEDLQGLLCVGALDVGGTNDLSAYVKVFYNDEIDKYIVYPYLFTPKDTITDREERDKVPYQRWVNDKHIIALEGTSINTKHLTDFINLDAGKYKEICFDDWGAYEIKHALAENFDMIDTRQGFRTFTPAIRGFENLLIAEKLIIHDNPCFNWMAQNVTAVTDDADNIKYSKKRSKNKIDGIVAMIMAFSRIIPLVNEPKPVELTADYIKSFYAR
ncbi:terminase TerL endonuclease subunit [Clostridium sp. BL-8]|uniref:terminase large subunit n=1 Tax=Clostridium sp. BL-8 TaxID=349938 RepID=UPI00098CE2F2|nr:terminase TerL endonuclease subunit [Clostridium sp. BL-8]OOM76585.1 phage terminase [Clostridium sp. BL-8]